MTLAPVYASDWTVHCTVIAQDAETNRTQRTSMIIVIMNRSLRTDKDFFPESNLFHQKYKRDQTKRQLSCIITYYLFYL